MSQSVIGTIPPGALVFFLTPPPLFLCHPQGWHKRGGIRFFGGGIKVGWHKDFRSSGGWHKKGWHKDFKNQGGWHKDFKNQGGKKN